MSLYITVKIFYKQNIFKLLVDFFVGGTLICVINRISFRFSTHYFNLVLIALCILTELECTVSKIINKFHNTGMFGIKMHRQLIGFDKIWQ
jgi:hypothetical protein